VTKRSRKNTATKVCGVVVTHFPPDGITARLAKIAKHVDALVVIDNSASAVITSLLAPAAAKPGWHLISNSENRGIATASNQGINFAQENGATWVAFFDHDTEPNDEFRGELDRIWSNYNGAKPLGIIGSNLYLAGTRNPRHPTADLDKKGYVQTTAVIASGSAYRMTMVSRLGLLKDEYFIDCVDKEYCWRALTNGYSVCRTTKPLVTHTLGAPIRHRVLGRTLTSLNHSAVRRYFIGRNNVLLFREYFFRLPGGSLDLLAYVVKTAVKICVVERERRKKLSCLLLGIWHGLLMRTDQKPWQTP